MFESDPRDVAHKLGLEFTAFEKKKGEEVVAYDFVFKFPTFTSKPLNEKTVAPVAPLGAEAIKAAQERANSPEGQAFADVVKRVTKFRKKVAPWTYEPAPPGTAGVIVAAKLSFGNRFSVAKSNKHNIRAMQKWMAPEALARRAAMAQTTPAAALTALRDTLKMYGITKPSAETVKLREALEKGDSIVALDGVQAAPGVQ